MNKIRIFATLGLACAVSAAALADNHDKNIEKCVEKARAERTIVDKIFDKVIPNYREAREGAARHNCELKEAERMINGGKPDREKPEKPRPEPSPKPTPEPKEHVRKAN